MSDDLVRILDGNTFVVSDSRGDIEASATDPTGLFSYDTRFLSRWVLTVDGGRLTSLSTDDLKYYESKFFLVPGTGSVYVNATMSVIRLRDVGGGFTERLTVLNHDAKPVDISVRLDAGSDFADLFEVKDALTKQGTYDTRTDGGRLVLGYQRGNYRRETEISSSEPAEISADGLTFAVHIEPHGEWSTDLRVEASMVLPDGQRQLLSSRGERDRGSMDEDVQTWLADAPRTRVRLAVPRGDLPA